MKPMVLCFTAGLLFLVLSGCDEVSDALFHPNDAPTVTELVANGRQVIPVSTDPVPVSGQGTSAAPLKVAPGSQVVVVCRATDSDDDPLTFIWKGTNVTQPTTQSQVLAWTAPAAEGDYVVTCVVDDGRGGTTPASVYAKVLAPGTNHAPTTRMEPNTTTLAPGGNANFACIATDVDSGDTLSYAFFAANGRVAPDPTEPTNTSKIRYTAPPEKGTFTIYCIVSDGKGANSVATATITVKQ